MLHCTTVGGSLEELEVILALLDVAAPFEFDDDNLPHLFADVAYCPEDIEDVFLLGEPQFYEDESGGAGEWLMVGRVPGDGIVVVPLIRARSTFTQLRPITIFAASRALAERYAMDQGW